MIRYTLSVDIPQDLIEKRAEAAGAWLRETIIKDTDPYVPAITGTLAANVYRDKEAIVYNMPYARYLYYGKLMIDPQTGSSYAPLGGRKTLTDKNLIYSKSMHPLAGSHWFERSKLANEEKWRKGVKKILAGE